MRKTASRMATLLLCVGSAGLIAAPARAADLVVTAYGGIWEQAFRSCYVQPFEKKTGKSVDVVLGTPVQWLNQVAANPKHPPIDVIVNSIDGADEAIKRHLVEKFSETEVPNLKEINPKLLAAGKGYGTILNYGAMGIAYNSDTVKNPPKTWKEFVDRTIKGDWKAAIPDVNYVATPVTTIWLYAHLYGGNVNNIQPGLAEIKKMEKSGNLVFWSDVNQFLNMMKSGDIDIGMYWDGRTWAFHDNGNPEVEYINPKPGAVINPTLVQKVKNSPALGWKFINFILSPGPQACWGNKLQYGMSNEKVKYSPKVAPRITKFSEILWPPFAEVPSHLSSWVEQWNKEIRR